MNQKYDVIVVGAGNAGLVCAATTAKNGLKTLLLEKHNLPGGCATSFRRGRFEFEPSLHELCSVGTKEKPGSVYKIFDGLGAKIDWRYERNTFRAIVKGKDGYDVTLMGGIEGFCDSLEREVPGCRESVYNFLMLCHKVNEALQYIDDMNGKPNLLVVATKYGDFMKIASHSVEEVMDSLGMPKKAQDIINTYWGYLGVPTDELNALHFLSMLYSYVVDGAGMPYLRSHELSTALCKVILDNGGDIWYNNEVTEFLFDESGAVIGVVSNGKKLYAREVVSNVICHNVINMTDGKNIPERTMKLANARDFGISIFTVYLGLDCPCTDLGIKDYTVFVMTDSNPRKQFEQRAEGSVYIVNCLNTVIPDCSPEGTCTLFFTIPFFGSDLPKNLSAENYKKWKNDIAKKYINDYEKVNNIDISSHIEEIAVATPVTFARYLGTPDGTIYGYMTSGWDNIINRISAEEKDFAIKGLSFCGGHSVRGDGYSSAYFTGDQVGKRIVNRIKEGE